MKLLTSVMCPTLAFIRVHDGDGIRAARRRPGHGSLSRGVSEARAVSSTSSAKDSGSRGRADDPLYSNCRDIHTEQNQATEKLTMRLGRRPANPKIVEVAVVRDCCLRIVG